MKSIKVANGIFWVEIPSANLRILCGCPADSVKHLSKRGLIAPTRSGDVVYETGPNAILLSDTPIQKGSFANLAEFPLLQMFYRQGMLIPRHPGNTGRKPLLIGLGDQVRSQAEYVFRGNYGLISEAELLASGATPQTAQSVLRVKSWFSFGRILPTSDLVQILALDTDAVELAPGVIVHRKGFNRYEFLSAGESLEVDLTLGPEEEYEPSYTLPARSVRWERFAVVHTGEGDGWDHERPCMASLVCCDGLLYLVDAGPHITRTLEALGLGAGDIEGIFQTHAHDDHFAGLTSLVRSERRIKYFAAPFVRATAAKKMAALMRIDEERFGRFFEVHDLVPGEWNDVAGLQVRPLLSPHPVETTAFFFRAGSAAEQRTYAHLADLPSFDVLAKLAAERAGGSALSPAERADFEREVLSPVDLKKVDVGGGLIHGEWIDFAEDRSRKLLLSHGITTIPERLSGKATVASFGDADVLIPGQSRVHLVRAARATLSAWFPGAPAPEIDALAQSPIVDLAPGTVLLGPSDKTGEVRLVISGSAEETDRSTGLVRRLSPGALIGAIPTGAGAPLSCRAVSALTVLAIPRRLYSAFLAKAGGPDALRQSVATLGFLSLCPLFAGVKSEAVLTAIAAGMRRHSLPRGQAARPGPRPELCLVSEGEVDLTVGEWLVESIGPGGFWGDERFVNGGPALTVARAVSKCQYFVIPAEILAGIPFVQWTLLETFERRLRSFRAGFRFEWSDAFRLGVAEIDEQHQKLFALVNDLTELIGRTRRITGHDAQKRELLEYTRLHFRTEEELMESKGYPRLEVQKKEHRELLERLERFGGAGERRTRPRAETTVDYLKDWLIRHSLLEDMQYREFLNGSQKT